MRKNQNLQIKQEIGAINWLKLERDKQIDDWLIKLGKQANVRRGIKNYNWNNSNDNMKKVGKP